MGFKDWKVNRSQLNFKRTNRKSGKNPWRLLLILAPLGILVYAAVFLLPDFLTGAWRFRPGGVKLRPEVIVVPPPSPKATESGKPRTMDKNRLAEIIGPRPFNPDELFTFKIEDQEGHVLFVRTTMNPGLQAWAIQMIPKVQALSAALVGMDPKTGEILAMASYSSDGKPVNLALNSSFPAASLFKIVTAAAAVEKNQMTSNTTLAYDGRKHTLYKSHLNGGIKQGRNQVTLREGFAESINTVFGKLGAFTLGPETLAGFAQRFHFNQPICFEMPVQKSKFDAPEDKDPYLLAELASGFNRTTKVSPLHGAMLASAIVNNGELMEPTVVREVFDQDNKIYYQHQPVSLGQVVSPRTVVELEKLMQATVAEGTGRKRFHDAGSHKVLSRLNIGGKSGTINNDQGHKVDWFVGYAKSRKDEQALALAVVVVHGEKMGLRSQELIREAIIQYFGS